MESSRKHDIFQVIMRKKFACSLLFIHPSDKKLHQHSFWFVELTYTDWPLNPEGGCLLSSSSARLFHYLSLTLSFGAGQISEQWVYQSFLTINRGCCWEQGWILSHCFIRFLACIQFFSPTHGSRKDTMQKKKYLIHCYCDVCVLHFPPTHFQLMCDMSVNWWVETRKMVHFTITIDPGGSSCTSI